MYNIDGKVHDGEFQLQRQQNQNLYIRKHKILLEYI